MLATTTSCGFIAAAAAGSGLVSAPRNRIRQPCERRTRPKAIRPMSCRSPGAQARMRERAGAAAPETGEREQPLADNGGGEVLLSDLELAALPFVPDRAQHRENQLTQDGFEREARERLVENGVHAGLVVGVGGGDADVLLRVLERRRRPGGRQRGRGALLRRRTTPRRVRASSARRARRPRSCRGENLPGCGSAVAVRSAAPTHAGARDSHRRDVRTRRCGGLRSRCDTASLYTP